MNDSTIFCIVLTYSNKSVSLYLLEAKHGKRFQFIVVSFLDVYQAEIRCSKQFNYKTNYTETKADKFVAQRAIKVF